MLLLLFCRMAGRLLAKVTRSSYLLAARGQIRQDHHATSLPAALRDEYYPKLGMWCCNTFNKSCVLGITLSSEVHIYDVYIICVLLPGERGVHNMVPKPGQFAQTWLSAFEYIKPGF